MEIVISIALGFWVMISGVLGYKFLLKDKLEEDRK